MASKTSSGTQALLIVILVLTFPFWISLIGQFFGVTINIFGMIISLIGGMIGMLGDVIGWVINPFDWHGHYSGFFLWLVISFILAAVIVSVKNGRKG